MIGCYHTLLRSGKATPIQLSGHMLLTNPPRTSMSTWQSRRKFSVIFARLKAIFGHHFVKRLSSSWIYQCVLKQSAYSFGLETSVIKHNRYYQAFKDGLLINFFNPAFLAASALPFTVRADSPKDCDSGTITDELMASHAQDLEYIKHLTKSTLICKSCSKRHLIDQVVDNVDYCQCQDKKPSVYGQKSGDVNWTPFLERKDILVWRQEHPDQQGLYAYKMYGRFCDISANEFLSVQLDLSEFRMSWDTATAQCHIIDVMENDKVNDARNVSHIYYWEVNWPRFFSNRDYVCSRRAKVFLDKDGNEEAIVLFTKSTQHRNCPKKSKAFRVEDYWSVLTIKPFTSCDENGIEFSVTAFENPGLSLPSYITTWVAIRAMPELMENLRQACKNRRKWLKSSDRSSTLKGPSKEPSYLETPKNYAEDRKTTHYA